MNAAGSELEFQPGSRGRVLRNLLGITRVRDMEEAETQALNLTQRSALKIFGPEHRFTPADIRRLHRMWLGSIYPWAGKYRTVNIGKGAFQFAHAPLIPRLMARLVALLMACQFGLGTFSLRHMAGAGKRTYVEAIRAAMSRDYAQLETLFALAIERRNDSFRN